MLNYDMAVLAAEKDSFWHNQNKFVSLYFPVKLEPKIKSKRGCKNL